MTPSSSPTPYKPRHRKSKLKWFGTMVGDAQHQEFVIAAPSAVRCLYAARLFFPNATIEQIQPVDLSSRVYD